MLTDKQILQGMWAALLRGDTAERDRLYNLFQHRKQQRERVQRGEPVTMEEPIELVIGEDGVARPKTVN